jgi:hypothetical protein
MDLFLVAASDACGGLGPIVAVIKSVFNIIKILVPIALLIMGVIDLAKAVLASDDKKIKEAQSLLVKRAIAAVAVFFAVTLVSAIMGLVGSGDDSGDGATSTSWSECWRNS